MEKDRAVGCTLLIKSAAEQKLLLMALGALSGFAQTMATDKKRKRAERAYDRKLALDSCRLMKRVGRLLIARRRHG